MIIKTRIPGLWVEFLKTQVVPTLTGIKRVYSDTVDSGYGTGLVYFDVDDDDEYVAMFKLQGRDIDEYFDKAIRTYVKEKWGHTI